MVTLGKYAFQNRTPVGFKELPDNLVNALIATEDERFYEHSGIDFRGTARAIVKMGKGRCKHHYATASKKSF